MSGAQTCAGVSISQLGTYYLGSTTTFDLLEMLTMASTHPLLWTVFKLVNYQHLA